MTEEKIEVSAERKNKNDQNVDGKHMPIMLVESLELLDLKPGNIVVDCTVNRGGHSAEFAKRIGASGVLVCIDLDSDALREAEENINDIFANNIKNKPSIHYICSNFANIKNILEELNINKVDAVYADLGISSQELDISGRGFSFMRDEPLLMTFKSKITEEDVTAKDIVNSWSQVTIADILFNFADEKYSRQISKAIAESRRKKDIETTFELIDIIKKSVPFYYQKGKSHFATRTFQALRMATNMEIDSVITLIQSLKDVLKENGKVGFITFHSTEDRIVKVNMKETGLTPINKKVIEATHEETRHNPRSRSAKLRFYTNN